MQQLGLFSFRQSRWRRSQNFGQKLWHRLVSVSENNQKSFLVITKVSKSRDCGCCHQLRRKSHHSFHCHWRVRSCVVATVLDSVLVSVVIPDVVIAILALLIAVISIIVVVVDVIVVVVDVFVVVVVIVGSLSDGAPLGPLEDFHLKSRKSQIFVVFWGTQWKRGNALQQR